MQKSSLEERKRHPDVIVVDPHEKGCDEQSLQPCLACGEETRVCELRFGYPGADLRCWCGAV